MRPSQSGGRGAGGRGRGRGRGNIGRDRDLIGQTIKITQGPYKSHIGIVKVSCKIKKIGDINKSINNLA